MSRTHQARSLWRASSEMLTKSNPPDLPSPSVQTTCASPRSASPPSNKKEKGIFSLVRRGPTERKPMPFSDRSRIMPPFSLPNSTYTNRSGFFRGVSLRSWFMIHLVTRATRTMKTVQLHLFYAAREFLGLPSVTHIIACFGLGPCTFLYVPNHLVTLPFDDNLPAEGSARIILSGRVAMRWTPGGESSDIEDRRDDTGGGGGFQFGGAHIGIGGAIILLILSVVFRQNFFALLGGGSVTSPTTTSQPDTARDETEKPLVQFVSFVLDDTQKTWAELLPQQSGKSYHHAKLVLFRASIQSGCGGAEAATGPFYCPRDEKAYLDL